MAHQRHLEKTKYRQWVKAGLGLTYLREGIAPFCDEIAKQQHKDILDNIKQTKSLSTVACGQCSWTTLRPDHAKGGNRSCMLGQRNCNCCNPAGKIVCHNKVCGAIYDAVVKNHGFTPPAPYWKNTETQHWCTDPWSIAKCFINAPGYDMKALEADIDCIGLLHLIRNNQYFHSHIQCTIAQTDIFSKVIADRNEIFHSSTMELEETKANNYIDDMIAVLQDSKELNNRQDTKDAVRKLTKLKNKDFIITTENEAKLIRDVAEEIRDMLARFETKTEDLARKEECERLRKRLSELESVISELKEEMNRLNADVSSKQESLDYEQSKLDLQTRLIKFYREDILRVSALPQQQEDDLCDFKDVYVRPRITIVSKDELDNKPKVADVLSMSDIFTKDSKPINIIYVLGEAGSGKSSFCKSLVNYWCLAHSDEGQIVDDEFNGVKEMKKFNFLFFLPLRHYTDKTKIKEMLEEKYEHPVFKKVLKYESRTCLVVLDGLDEWASPASKCPPARGALKEYTVLTTSRPWKVATLGISDNELRQKIIIKGFDGETSLKYMIEKTVSILNKRSKKNKVSSDCEKALENESVASLTQTAIMLQQLICLWFEDELRGGTSRCALYTKMLDLFFVWNKTKYSDEPLFIEKTKKSKDLKNVELPRYFKDTEVCKSYSYIIHDVSRLAYKTLFNNTKNTSLSFDSSTFDGLNIPKEVRTFCLKLGILSEDKCVSLSASRSRRSVIAFVHKSFQEYLAAVYIAIRYKDYIASSADSGNQDLSDRCALPIRNLYSKCETLDEILELANVYIVLCGLEPRIATSISKYIYDIVTRDNRVLEYRRIAIGKKRHLELITDIQECVLSCIEEVQACESRIQAYLNLGDIFIYFDDDIKHLCESIERQFISANSVISFYLIQSNKCRERVLKYLPKYQRLESIYIKFGFYINDDEEIKSLCDAIESNTTTLKALRLKLRNQSNVILKTIVRHLPDMIHLVALKIEDAKITHTDAISLFTFLSGSSNLEQISILFLDVFYFECEDHYEVDLSKHQQLQCLELGYNLIRLIVTRFNTCSLEIFNYYELKNTNYVKIFDNLSAANKLTNLVLGYDEYYNCSYHTVTDELIKLLLSLHQLSKLTLVNFTLTDNIMKCACEMKRMKSICLYKVTMSLTTWREFVDSLPLIPLPVEVSAYFMCITRDEEERNPGSDSDGKECNPDTDSNGEECNPDTDSDGEEFYSDTDSDGEECYSDTDSDGDESYPDTDSDIEETVTLMQTVMERTVILIETVMERYVTLIKTVVERTVILMQTVMIIAVTYTNTDSDGEEYNPYTDSNGEECKPDTDNNGEECKPDTDNNAEECNLDTHSEGEVCNPDTDSDGEECNPDTDSDGEECNPDTDNDGDGSHPDTDSDGEECNPHTDERYPCKSLVWDCIKDHEASFNVEREFNSAIRFTDNDGDGSYPDTDSDGEECNPDTDNYEDELYPDTDSDREECNPNNDERYSCKVIAWQYVRDHEASFNVELVEFNGAIRFSTKKEYPFV